MLKPENKNLLIYISKCITGGGIVFLLSWLFNYPEVSWCIISVILVLTPESKEAIPLAIMRIKANLLGGLTSLIFMMIFPTNQLTILTVIAITILGCNLFNIMTGSRAAIAAVIIIMMHGMETPQQDFWKVTLERIAMVIAGCVIGLVVTLLFHRDILQKEKVDKPQQYEH
jgi:uncharacterized membrane protein YgaE (UPF0421/DUF939 family)